MGHEPKITFCWFIPPSPRWLLIYLNLSPWVKHSHQNFHFSDWILGESKSRSQNSLLLAVGEDRTFKPLPALMEGGAKECSESWGPRSQARLSHKTHRVQEMPACAVLLGAPIQGSSTVMVQEEHQTHSPGGEECPVSHYSNFGPREGRLENGPFPFKITSLRLHLSSLFK